MIEVSAHDLCRTRLCATPGCEWDTQPGSPCCFDCDRGKGQALLRAIVNPDNVSNVRAEKGVKLTGRYGKYGRSFGDLLSPGEVRVLQAAADGNSIRETALKLSLSANTVKTYRCRAMGKLDANGTLHAVAVAWRRGLIT